MTTNRGMCVRWMTNGDLQRVAGINRKTHPEPWDRQRINAFRCAPRNGGFVAEETMTGYIYGYVLYSYVQDAYEIKRIGVDPSDQRLGIASAIVEKMRRVADSGNRVLEVIVPEECLGAQLLFRSCGFAADRRSVGGGYLMRTGGVSEKWLPRNRIRSYLNRQREAS